MRLWVEVEFEGVDRTRVSEGRTEGTVSPSISSFSLSVVFMFGLPTRNYLTVLTSTVLYTVTTHRVSLSCVTCFYSVLYIILYWKGMNTNEMNENVIIFPFGILSDILELRLSYRIKQDSS